MGKKSNGKSLLQRLRFKYKLAILNENTLEEIWRIRLSKLSVISLGFSIAVIYFFLIAILIIKTPLRGFLPGYTENINLKKQLTLNSLVVDSISEKVRLQSQYVQLMHAVVKGDILVDSTTSVESLKRFSSEELTNASEKEMAFRDSFEAQEIVVSTKMSDLEEGRNYLMQAPAKGRILEAFNPRLHSYGVTLSVDQQSSVCAVLDGVIVSSEYSLNNIYVLTVQHPDNMMSIYKIRQPYLKKVGEKVHAGEIISTFHNGADSYFEFQLWKDGTPLDPQTFITF